MDGDGAIHRCHPSLLRRPAETPAGVGINYFVGSRDERFSNDVKLRLQYGIPGDERGTGLVHTRSEDALRFFFSP